MTDITIYQGNQIGGCITLIKTDKAKIVIDFGESLPGSEVVENIEFNWKKEKVDAVFFTHYHGDHIGRFMEIPDDVPLYMGKVTYQVLLNINETLKKEEVVRKLQNRENIFFISQTEKIDIKDISITPYSVDHSAFDAYMFLVETPDKNILHTGDYRDHGHRGHVKKYGRDINVIEMIIKKYVLDYGKRKIDVLITEGTMMGHRKGEKRYSEKQLLEDATNFFKEHKYVFLKISSTNADSLASFYHAAKRNGMGFYANSYVLKQLDLFKEAAKQYTNFYSFDRKWPIVFSNGKTKEKQRKYMRENGFVIVISEYTKYEELIEEFADLNPVLIYSLWEGYINEKVGKGAYNPILANFCKKYNAIKMHTSGHAYPEIIEKVVRLVNAKEVKMIHTEVEVDKVLFKDSSLVRNKRQVKDALKEIAEIIQNSEKNECKEDYLRKVLLNGQKSERLHKPNHDVCTGFIPPQKGKFKEKRICHCMNYYMKKPEICKNCSMDNKWKNIGKIQITDFEVPTKYVYEGVGGIDLIFNDEYAVEIKPPNSSESLARMFAEILTYTIEEAADGKKYNPAICLFSNDNNVQMRQFKELKENEYLKYIMRKVKVFYFKVENFEKEIIEYSIHPIEELF